MIVFVFIYCTSLGFRWNVGQSIQLFLNQRTISKSTLILYSFILIVNGPFTFAMEIKLLKFSSVLHHEFIIEGTFAKLIDFIASLFNLTIFPFPFKLKSKWLFSLIFKEYCLTIPLSPSFVYFSPVAIAIFQIDKAFIIHFIFLTCVHKNTLRKCYIWLLIDWSIVQTFLCEFVLLNPPQQLLKRITIFFRNRLNQFFIQLIFCL